MSSYYQTFDRKTEALTKFNGYTMINGKIFVMNEIATSNLTERLDKVVIVSGFEYDTTGRRTNLNEDDVRLLIKRLNLNPLDVEFSEIGYIDSEGRERVEKSVVLTFDYENDIDLGVKAEKLRMCLGQSFVSVQTADQQSYFVH